MRAELDKPFTGDLDEMVKRRLVRIGVPYSRTHYFVDQGVQRGVAYEYGKLMEDELNKRRKTGNMKVAFWFVTLPRDRLLPALVDGRVDMVIAALTVTPERQKLVDFTKPTRENVSEIVVTGPGAPPINSVDDLSGQEVFVRKSSSYYQSLLSLNQRLKAAGKSPVMIEEAPENLEDDDLLEMVNAGLIEATVVDDYIAKFWKEVFTDLVVHEGVAVRTGGTLAVAIRKGSPQLAQGLNVIIDEYGLGTVFGNMMQKRYLVSTKFVKNSASEAERKKFLAMVDLFKKYSDQYDVDYLLMAAQGFQESGLDQSVRSQVGAVGVMQVMPATAKDLNVGDIRQLEPNIHAGIKYMRWMVDHYFKDEPMDALNKGLFAFASYNAGPGRIRQLRQEAAKRGLDPNVWFGNVEQIASERIGRETVTYVSNIYKYYVAYRLVTEERERREAAKKGLGSPQEVD
ncbi:MAG TPA: transporter substrate-binding domain-containing protein [Steroidobacteraceae bacterium]|nr:transporter substrate-binding domain-containing protein [Steroidobacteraceae bacterium]